MPETSNLQRCPYCLEQIPQKAQKCRFCGEWVNKKRKKRNPRSLKQSYLVWFITLAIFHSLCLMALNSDEPGNWTTTGAIALLIDILIGTLAFLYHCWRVLRSWFQSKTIREPFIFTLLTLVTFVLFFGIFALYPTTTPESSDNKNQTCDEQQSISAARNCTLLVITDLGHGTGFSTQPGYLITNKHVIEGASEIKTWWDGEERELTLWNYAPTLDLAILKLPMDDVPTCAWHDSSQMNIAETLYAVGWPNTPVGDVTITRGIYSRTNTYEGDLEFIQTDAAINPGNSGGPLVNRCGVIGINTLKESWSDEGLPRPLEGLGNALSSNTIRSVIDTLIAEGNANTKAPGAKAADSPRNPSAPAQTASLDITEIAEYRNDLLQAKQSWENASNVPRDKLAQLHDSFTRQIEFCNTLIQRLQNSRSTSKDDLIMWDAIVKMSYESSALAAELNAYQEYR